MSWLQEHIDGFVKPHLTSYGEDASLDGLKKYNANFVGGFFTQEEMTVIKNAWRSTKREAAGKTLLLAGRDVFIFEILARRENYPTVFRPEISRNTVYEAKAQMSTPNAFLFDTGFAGSIPRGLSILDFRMLSANIPELQVFPRLSFSRGLALKIESTPKYWESGRVIEFDGVPKIVQPYSREVEFYHAACLTVEVYTNSAPKFIHKHKPMLNERRWF